MALKVERAPHASGAEVFRLQGPLTLGREAQSFEAAIAETVKGGQTRIVVDLSEVPYVDSAGVGILMGSHGKVAEAGGKFRVAGATERVRQVFRMTKVDSILVLDETAEAALAAMAG